MGTLANSFFQLLLSWIRILCAEIWNAVSSKDGSALVNWIGKNWLTAAIFLCLAGMAVDLIVYLFRWQPYRVWKSRKLQRKRKVSNSGTSGKETEEEETETRGPSEPKHSLSEPEMDGNRSEWTGSSALYEEADERVPDEIPNQQAEVLMIAESQKRFSRPERKHAKLYVESAYDEPEEELFVSDFRTKAEIDSYDQESNTVKFEKAIRPRRRRRVREMLADNREDMAPAPEQLIDQNEAYHQPIYPRSWQERERDPK